MRLFRLTILVEGGHGIQLDLCAFPEAVDTMFKDGGMRDDTAVLKVGEARSSAALRVSKRDLSAAGQENAGHVISRRRCIPFVHTHRRDTYP